MATHLYRVAQEGISNSVKHGKSKKVQVTLVEKGQIVILQIEDWGKGLPEVLPEPRGMGLRIMQYRAGIIGASLTIQNNADGGVTIICSWQRK